MLANALLSGLVLIVPLIGAVAAAPARPGRPALLVMAPWADGDALLADVGAPRLITGARAIGAETLLSADQLASVRTRAEVWLALDLTRLAAICGNLEEDR